MNLTTVTARAAAAAVAGVAGFASFRHIVEVGLNAGESPAVAYALPAAIDGLIVTATMAMLEDKRHGRKPRVSARWALAAGVLATLAANIASAEPTAIARAVAAVPAVAFLLAVEVLSRTGRRAEGSQAEDLAVSSDVKADITTQVPEPVAAQPRKPRKRAPAKQPRRTPAETVALVEQIKQEVPDASQAELAGRIGISPRRLRAVLASPQPEGI